MQRIFEDGPKRDRRLWIGDLRIQALTNYYTYKNNDMVKGCLYLFAALPCENGQVGACVFLDPEPEVDPEDPENPERNGLCAHRRIAGGNEMREIPAEMLQRTGSGSPDRGL